jgi:hypothetical protein
VGTGLAGEVLGVTGLGARGGRVAAVKCAFGMIGARSVIPNVEHPEARP